MCVCVFVRMCIHEDTILPFPISLSPFLSFCLSADASYAYMQESTFSHRGSRADSLCTDENLEWNKWRRCGGVAVEEKKKESLNAQVRIEI